MMTRRAWPFAMTNSNPSGPFIFTVSHELDTFRCSTKARSFAAQLGFSTAAQWQIAIALSELVSNAVRYAGRGRVTVCALSNRGFGIELRVEDCGPGMAGSNGQGPTRKGLGAGLSAVSRLMDEVRVESATGVGTVVVARKWCAKTGS